MSHGREAAHAGRRPPDILVTLVEAYEAKHYPIAGPTRLPRFCIVWKRCR